MLHDQVLWNNASRCRCSKAILPDCCDFIIAWLIYLIKLSLQYWSNNATHPNIDHSTLIYLIFLLCLNWLMSISCNDCLSFPSPRTNFFSSLIFSSFNLTYFSFSRIINNFFSSSTRRSCNSSSTDLIFYCHAFSPSFLAIYNCLISYYKELSIYWVITGKILWCFVFSLLTASISCCYNSLSF